MAYIRVVFETSRESARKFDKAVLAGSPFVAERERALNHAWSLGHTPTGKVHYRGIANGQPLGLKFDVEVDTTH